MKLTILITGCSSGIGYGCAKALVRDGHRVLATCRDSKDVQKLQSQGLEAFKLDVTDAEDIQKMYTYIHNEIGSLDVLFNNAGYGQPGALEDLPLIALKEQFETNLFGVFALTQTMLPLLRKSKSAKIIQNSSVLGLVSLKYRGAYNASKYALEGLSDTWRLELAPFGIYVSLIEPGPITSAFRFNAYQKFKEHIDIRKSHYQSDYLTSIKRFESDKKDPFTLEEDAVYKVVSKIIKSSRPRPRYYVTFPTHFLGFLKRVLSSRLLDRVLQNV